jgi:hypothetical protein
VCFDFPQHLLSATFLILRIIQQDIVTIQISHQPDATFFQFIILTLFTAQHVSGVLLPIIRSSMTAVAASCFTFILYCHKFTYCVYCHQSTHYSCRILIELEFS